MNRTVSGGLMVRPMEYPDVGALARSEREQGWSGSEEKLQSRWADLQAGKAVGFVAEYAGGPAGYIFVYPEGLGGPFGGRGIPEIVDFNVLVKYRRRGIGTALMDAAEETAAGYGDSVYLAVGLHSGYGSAQRMYVKRGYVPDGSGVWYGEAVCPAYGPCRNDDDLVLHFLKRLGGARP
ncbi:GNAT family N-acetyltransferase [Acutalibacter caecimuris]|uniref:GNAT family N-acetyltransferase n=1 Tax=Acutalibacter caecimuris TaxID=3093657 RepID=UPI002AC8D9E1|nr:GNAT family N-acetyltransferase [Acutalibacter sp. M00118]